jgi:nucleotide-binding universal stress UspA family protein|nr:hypothetical protein [Solirubrobacteraceae bacterium]
MTVVAWIRPAGWQAVADAAAALGDADVVLLHVIGEELEAASGAMAGLLGRHRPPHEHHRLESLSEEAADELLASAEAQLGRPARRELRRGRAEREVIEAVAAADLLVLSRDARHSGPKSLAPPTRFVVDHAPCRVLLVWP